MCLYFTCLLSYVPYPFAVCFSFNVAFVNCADADGVHFILWISLNVVSPALGWRTLTQLVSNRLVPWAALHMFYHMCVWGSGRCIGWAHLPFYSMKVWFEVAKFRALSLGDCILSSAVVWFCYYCAIFKFFPFYVGSERYWGIPCFIRSLSSIHVL